MITLLYNLAFLKFKLDLSWTAWQIGAVLAITVICDAVIIAFVLNYIF